MNLNLSKWYFAEWTQAQLIMNDLAKVSESLEKDVKVIYWVSNFRGIHGRKIIRA